MIRSPQKDVLVARYSVERMAWCVYKKISSCTEEFECECDNESEAKSIVTQMGASKVRQ